MIKYIDGTVFNTEAQAMVNTVNCMGVMGSGIALEFMLRYPDMYDDYVKKCKKSEIRVGQVDYFSVDEKTVIINFPTKMHFKFPSKLSWIEQGLLHFKNTYRVHGIDSVAFPKLGTSSGGLNWNDVKPLMERYLSDLDIDVIICLNTASEAMGAEKAMLGRFNQTDMDILAKTIRLSRKQREALRNHQPYQRFWQIGETASIGSKTYNAIFRYFYKEAGLNIEHGKDPVQISLFD